MVSAKATEAATPASSSVAESSRLQLAITLFCVLLIAAVWTVTMVHVREERSEDVAEAQRRNTNLAVALEEQTIRTLKGTNQALSLVKHEVERTGARPVIQALVDKGALDDSLFDRIEIADERGNLAGGSGAPGSLNVADRDFFDFLRRQATDELFISNPCGRARPTDG